MNVHQLVHALVLCAVGVTRFKGTKTGYERYDAQAPVCTGELHIAPRRAA